MISIETFFRNYQIHHFRTKSIYLKKLLDNPKIIEAKDIQDATWRFDRTDIERSLRIELRANLFHAIETLFTLYFCLHPDQEGVVDDFSLFKNINKKIFTTIELRIYH